MNYEALQKLERVLNATSSSEPEVLLKKTKMESSSSSLSATSHSATANDEPAQETAEASNVYYWMKYFDVISSRYYYHNHQTKVTQWEIPVDYVDPPSSVAVSSSLSPSNLIAGSGGYNYYNDNNTTAASGTNSNNYSADMYKSSASFTTRNGAFGNAGTGSYWDNVNRPNDKDGRQMSAFFDVTELEHNRLVAKQKKEQLQKQHQSSSSGVDWKQYKSEKQIAKKKKRSEWLLNE